MSLQINRNTTIQAENISVPVGKAVEAFYRDLRNTCTDTEQPGLTICLALGANPAKGSAEEDTAAEESGRLWMEAEQFTLQRTGDKLLLTAGGDLGFIYGIYHISRTFLGVQDFWFWNEQSLVKKAGYHVPEDYHYESVPAKVRFRGWFINDEVLFDEWKPRKENILSGAMDYGKTVEDSFPWEMAFEALLRCGGNMVIPGTDFNAHIYKKTARDYGLWITHHHAEPLGARMFARAYPDLDASFDKHGDLFRGLWKEAIEEQKDCKVIWNLGFRGQGDRPFWADDPTYETPAARGKLMSDLILEQYHLVKASDPQAVCCTNLYGETMELYRDGFLSFPEDVIKIWADNGFGKMVSRRQNNHNPRVEALPKEGDTSAHGIYYHASFYDLQAAGQMTMLPNSPEFVAKELQDVYAHGVEDFWLINCSNVKPHTYYLDLIAGMWQGGTGALLPGACTNQPAADRAVETVDAIAKRHPEHYVRTYYGNLQPEISQEIRDLYALWPSYAIQYGPHEDDHAGEQFPNHGARILASGFLRNFRMDEPEKAASLPELDWVCKADTLLEQVQWYEEKFRQGERNYREYLGKCLDVRKKLEAAGGNGEKDRAAAAILDHNLMVQVRYLHASYLGALHICRALETCLDTGKTGSAFIDVLEEGEKGKQVDYLSAFYEAGLAAKAFFEGYDAMRDTEEGIWKNFYRNDCEADIRQSGYVARSLMGYLRVLGDGPHFYQWQRKFQKESGGEKVHLILRIKPHLTDEELWHLMEETREK